MGFSFPPAVRGMRAAFVFLTRLPLGGYPYSDEDFAWAPAYGPLVGGVVGGLGGLAATLCFGAGVFAAALIGLAVTMMVTGGFHEDGLADTADALGGAIFDREKLLEILKDSRIGTYGALALVVSIGLRTALLADVAWSGAGFAGTGFGLFFAFLCTGVLARIAPVWLMAAMPYVTDPAHARSRPVVKAGMVQAVVATLLGIVFIAAASVIVPASGEVLVRSVVVLVPVTCLLGWRFHRRAGGITGDFLGATEQVAEVVVLLTLALAG